MRTVADTFCALPFRRLQLQPDGLVKVCCVDQVAGADRDGSSVHRHSLAEIWNSARFRRMRRAMSAGQPLASCEACYTAERTGGSSTRTIENARAFGPPGAREAATQIQRLVDRSRPSDFVLREPPQELLLEVGNACNLACRMCHALSSSRIQSDPVHGAWAAVPSLEAESSPSRLRGPWHRDEAFVSSELLRDATALRQLQIIGGETMLSRGGLLVLRELVRRGAAGDISLVINTNGTVLDEEWLELLGHFKTVALSVSLDGVGVVNDYIRYPSRFDEVMASTPRFRQVPGATVMVTTTLQAYNALGFSALLDFCDGQALRAFVFPLQWPAHLAVAVLPPRARALAAARLREYLARRGSAMLHYGAEALVPTLEAPGDQWDRELAAVFMEFTNDLDGDRGQRLASVAPEIVAHFAEAGMPWDERTRHLEQRTLRRLDAGSRPLNEPPTTVRGPSG